MAPGGSGRDRRGPAGPRGAGAERLPRRVAAGRPAAVRRPRQFPAAPLTRRLPRDGAAHACLRVLRDAAGSPDRARVGAARQRPTAWRERTGPPAPAAVGGGAHRGRRVLAAGLRHTVRACERRPRGHRRGARPLDHGGHSFAGRDPRGRGLAGHPAARRAAARRAPCRARVTGAGPPRMDGRRRGRCFATSRCRPSGPR